MDKFKPGDYYEDCAYHPCLCISVNEEEDNISGISLIDGSYPRSCSLDHCGVRKLTLEEVTIWKHKGPQDLHEPWAPLPDRQWWWLKPIEGINPSSCLEHLFNFSLNFIRNNAEIKYLPGQRIIGGYGASGSFISSGENPTASASYTVKVEDEKVAIVQVKAIKEGRLWP